MQESLYNLAFERAVLSSLLFNPSSLEDIISTINAYDFYHHAHGAIYEAMINLENQNKPIDEEFLKKELVKVQKFDEMVMLEILTANPISNTKAYIEELVDKSRLRKLLNVTNTIKKGVLEENLSSDDVISTIEDELTSIVDMSSDDFGMRSIDEVEDAQTEYILKDWLPLPRGTVSFIAAPGGTGKSWAALQLAIRHAKESGKEVAVWLSEDQDYESKSRAKAICQHIIRTPFELKNVKLISRSPLQLIINQKFSYSNFFKIKKVFKNSDVIVLDPLLAFYGGEENNNTQARMFMQPFMDWAKESGKCIVFLHHSKKGEEGGMRGASAFVDGARTVYEIFKIDKDTDSDEREFVLTKDNYGVIKMLKTFKVRRAITPKPIKVVEYVYEEQASNEKIEVVTI